MLATAPRRVPPQPALRPSAQRNQPARVWFTGYRCEGREATRPQQWAEVMRARYET
ncbi:hypothetical protein ACFWVF_21675 [Streptomyces sp. NPDC058659]|uniref:hypothetical protein n=1 Tax=unclassified Streptomyces TaxID=2593676 RepID=UPI0036535458